MPCIYTSLAAMFHHISLRVFDTALRKLDKSAKLDLRDRVGFVRVDRAPQLLDLALGELRAWHLKSRRAHKHVALTYDWRHTVADVSTASAYIDVQASVLTLNFWRTTCLSSSYVISPEASLSTYEHPQESLRVICHA